MIRGIALFSTLPVYPDLKRCLQQLEICGFQTSTLFTYDASFDTPDVKFADLQFHRYAVVEASAILNVGDTIKKGNIIKYTKGGQTYSEPAAPRPAYPSADTLYIGDQVPPIPWPGHPSVTEIEVWAGEKDLMDIVVNYNTLSAKPVLEMNAFSYNKQDSRALYVYNQRLFASSTKVTAAQALCGIQLYKRKRPYNENMVCNYADTLTRYVKIKLVINNKIYIVQNIAKHATLRDDYTDITNKKEINTEDMVYGYMLSPVICYPDIRAVEICGMKAKKHETLNFAFVFIAQGLDIFKYGSIIYNTTGCITPNDAMFNQDTAIVTNNTWQDDDVVRVSALNNPLVYPAALTYDVNHKVVGFCSNTVPLSTGQYGQHPMFVFTQGGVYALQLGTGEVVVERMLPLNELVCLDARSITSAGGGVCFLTQQGVFYMAGAQAKNISKVLYPEYDSSAAALSADSNINNIITLPICCGMNASMKDMQFKENVRKLYYDYTRNELVARHSGSDCFIYSVDSGVWSRITHAQDDFCVVYPYLISYRYNAGSITLANMSVESSAAGAVNRCFYMTRPFRVGMGYNKIRRLFVRGYFDVSRLPAGVVFGGYLFASNDGYNWVCVDAVEVNSPNLARDIENLQSKWNACYYILALGGGLTRGSYFTHIEYELTHAMGQQLR